MGTKPNKTPPCAERKKKKKKGQVYLPQQSDISHGPKAQQASQAKTWPEGDIRHNVLD